MKSKRNIYQQLHESISPCLESKLDIQYVLDPYSCVVYICDYLMKNNKGMSMLLENAAKEARKGNMNLKQSVRHIGNKFLNCSEMSEQECAYSLLELPITQSSIRVEFINTSEIPNKSIHHQTRPHITKNGPQLTKNKTGKQHRQIFVKTKHPQRYVLS